MLSGPILAYSPPYGENYFKDMEVFSFMHSCGINTVKLILSNSSTRLGIPYSPYPLIWRGADDYDFSVVDRQIGDIAERNPDVRFIAMVDLNSPPWMVEATGKNSFNELGECFLDPDWLRAVSDYQQKLVAYLESRYADRITGYYVACGKTQEWFDHGMVLPSPRRVANYPAWCRANGRTLLAVPEPGEYDRCREEVLPEHLAQYLDYGASLTRDCAEYFFSRIRDMIRPGVKLYGVFGNIHDIGSLAHVHCESLLKKSLLDVYIGPSCNSEIAMGGAGGFQSSRLMLEKYGVHYLHSCDRQLSTTVTEIGPGVCIRPEGNMCRQRNAKEDVACLKREFSLALVHGFSLWFFNIWGGAYSGSAVRSLLADCGRLWKEYSTKSSGSDTETLLVFSPESRLYFPPVREEIIAHQLRRVLLPEANIHFTTAAVSDLYEADLDRFRMVVFLYVDYLSDADRQMIKTRVCCNDRVVVWCNQPGIADVNGIDHSRMEELCGVPAHGTTAAEKTFDGWRSVVLPDMASCTPQALHRAGEMAGIHFFTGDPDLKVWSSKEFLSAHTRDGGTKTIRLKRRAGRVIELFSGKIIAENTDIFTDDFAAPDTRLYYLEN